MSRAFASVIRFCVVCGSSALGLGSCAGQEAQQLTPSLSQTRAAQAAFRKIVRRWFEEDEARRVRLRPSLEHFLADYGDDPRAKNARLLLAWLSILSGDFAEARQRISEGRSSSSPSVRDFAELLAARLMLAQKEPERALGVLSQIEGKLVDPAVRLICSELRLQAALASRQFAEALSALSDYLAAAPAELGDRVRERAKTALDALPSAALESRLGELQDKAARGPLPAADVWLRRMVRERLIRLAVEQKDARLARRLLDSDPGLARRNELSLELLQLAASAAQAADAQGAFVGLALEVGEPDAERRSASVARGLSASLSASLPGADSLPIVVKASDAEHVGSVLSELAASGALALVAGASDTSVERAAIWAATGSAPVLLLRDTPNLTISELSFVLGTSDMDQLDAIHKELERRKVSRWMRVGPGGFDCHATSEKAGDLRFPVKSWRQEDIPAVAILGPRSCVLELYAEAREQHFTPLLALGLEGAEVLPSLAGKSFALGGGGFPSVKPGIDVAEDFYELLGRDAGSLVRRAWAQLGGVGAKRDEKLRERLPRALSEVSVPLETTDATGFSGRRRLPRRLAIREAP
jgi:predicted negative regulator of RcsB-dependent stress response